jgi:GR25 family glycosyltransferase involved in LPS biosynthesis
MSDNTLACTLSHFKAWQTFLDDPDAGEHAVVLEDDVELAARSVSVIRDLFENRLWGYKLIKLEQGGAMRNGAFVGHRGEMRQGYALREAHQVLAGAAAYALSREGAAHFLGFRDSIAVPVDHFLFYPVRRRGFWGGPYAAVDPAIAVQDWSLGSDINHQRNLKSRKGRNLARALHEGHQARRILGGLLRRRRRWVAVRYEP